MQTITTQILSVLVVVLVINEDTVLPGYGFGAHPHDKLEIISYVIEGALEHKDSMGTGSIIKPGEIQRMSAGTGVRHSEFNHSKTDLLHFLQIWIIPKQTGLKPSYEQKAIAKIDNKLILIGSPDGRDGSVTIHQNVDLYAAYLATNTTVNYNFNQDHQGWLQLIKGKINLNGQTLSAGDGVAIMDERAVQIQSTQDAELLLFDLG